MLLSSFVKSLKNYSWKESLVSLFFLAVWGAEIIAFFINLNYKLNIGIIICRDDDNSTAVKCSMQSQPLSWYSSAYSTGGNEAVIYSRWASTIPLKALSMIYHLLLWAQQQDEIIGKIRNYGKAHFLLTQEEELGQKSKAWVSLYAPQGALTPVPVVLSLFWFAKTTGPIFQASVSGAGYWEGSVWLSAHCPRVCAEQLSFTKGLG